MTTKQTKTAEEAESARLAKNQRIKETGAATRARHAQMDVVVRELKIVENKLSTVQKEALNRLFLEAKWLRNAALAAGRFDGKFPAEQKYTVKVKTKDGIEPRELKICRGFLAASVMNRLSTDRNTLAKKKKHGGKIGKLKFKGEISVVDLQSRGTAYNIDLKWKRIHICNVKGWLKARGFNNIPKNAEFANAKLVHRADGFFLQITCFVPKDAKIGRKNQDFQPGTEVGIDMGIKTHVTSSDGVKIDATVEETEQIRGLRKKLSRQKKGSNNYRKTLERINRGLRHQVCQRNDLANKIAHELLKHEVVYFQDENLKTWGTKRQMHSSVLGRLKEILKDHPRAVMLDKTVATTATCQHCGQRTKHTPEKRTYVCPNCGYTADRDIHAAQNMVLLGRKTQQTPRVERTGSLAEDIIPAETDFASIKVANNVRFVIHDEARSVAGL